MLVMLQKTRCGFSSKHIFYFSILGMLFILYVCLTNSNNALYGRMRSVEKTMSKLIVKLDEKGHVNKSHFQDELKYILLWTPANTIPFVDLGEGQKSFIQRKCKHVNCFVTDDKTFFDDLTKYDVIAFAGPQLIRQNPNMPSERSPHQKYVFASLESPDIYPVCSNKYNNVFNWTWTFRTDSTERWGYMAIRDSSNKVIGPNSVMHWMKLSDMDPVSDEFKEKLKSKRKAAAWFVSNCNARSGRDKFVKLLQDRLKEFNLGVDIYGHCGTLTCRIGSQEECNKMLETDYYFYLSFENSFAEDYVTEKLLYPLQNNAIPIVFGAANYTRFMPDGIYLNARTLGVDKLAEKMIELITNPDLYADYFRWKKYYSYHDRAESEETDDICRYCAMLNDKALVEETSVYEDFRKWWDPPNRC